MSQFAVILPAAGGSSRFHGFGDKKPFVSLAGRAVWQRTVDVFAARHDVGQIILVLADEDRDDFQRRFGDAAAELQLAAGGASRAESVRNALQQLSNDCDYIAVHDAARPLVSQQVIDRVFQAAIETGAAIPGVPVTSTVKCVDESERIAGTVDRTPLRLAQTPQTFAREILLKAVAQSGNQLASFTDEASLVEAAGMPVTVTEGAWDNIKITTAEDFRLAQLILAGQDAAESGG